MSLDRLQSERPQAEGVIGRKAGADPAKMFPGTSMAGALRVASASEREGIVAHLRRQDKSIDLCM